MKLRTGMWVVALDGSRGLVLVNEGTAFEPSLKTLRSYGQDNPRTSEQSRDRETRVFQSADGRRSTAEMSDLHQKAEDRFIAGIVADLDREAADNAFKAIAIAAPPSALGLFRKLSGDELSRRVVLWIDKDFTRHPVPDIAALVAKALET